VEEVVVVAVVGSVLFSGGGVGNLGSISAVRTHTHTETQRQARTHASSNGRHQPGLLSPPRRPTKASEIKSGLASPPSPSPSLPEEAESKQGGDEGRGGWWIRGGGRGREREMATGQRERLMLQGGEAGGGGVGVGEEERENKKI
jgi:hypothetical protein